MEKVERCGENITSGRSVGKMNEIGLGVLDALISDDLLLFLSLTKNYSSFSDEYIYLYSYIYSNI